MAATWLPPFHVNLEICVATGSILLDGLLRDAGAAIPPTPRGGPRRSTGRCSGAPPAGSRRPATGSPSAALPRGALRRGVPVVQQQHLRRGGGEFFDVVADEDGRRGVGFDLEHSLDGREHLLAGEQVQAAGRLVQQQQCRLDDQRRAIRLRTRSPLLRTEYGRSQPPISPTCASSRSASASICR